MTGSYGAMGDGDVIVLSGPAYPYRSESPADQTVGTVEIEHVHMSALRSALTGLA